MTRRYFDTQHTTGPVRVILGYDRPLDEYFLQVRRQPRVEDEEIEEDNLYVYLSLADPDARIDDLDYFRTKLRELALQIPESMFLAVTEDAVNRAGNLTAEHFSNGRIMLRRTDD